MVAPVLQHFQITEAQYLGSGGESIVYALDQERIVRIYKPGITVGLIEKRCAFYRRIQASHATIALPQILEIDSLDGFHFSIERRIPGSNLIDALSRFGGALRHTALEQYAHAATQIRTLALDVDCYGELLAEHPVTRPTWPDFLIARAEQSVQHADAELRKDFPQLDETLRAWAVALAELVGTPEPRLVHGDYFPGNVMVDEAGHVTGVIDFSPLTVAGDWRLDLVGALLFLEVTPTCVADDAATVRDTLAAACSTFSNALVDCYRAYYSFYFRLTRRVSPRLYAWCVENLQKLQATW